MFTEWRPALPTPWPAEGGRAVAVACGRLKDRQQSLGLEAGVHLQRTAGQTDMEAPGLGGLSLCALQSGRGAARPPEDRAGVRGTPHGSSVRADLEGQLLGTPGQGHRSHAAGPRVLPWSLNTHDTRWPSV